MEDTTLVHVVDSFHDLLKKVTDLLIRYIISPQKLLQVILVAVFGYYIKVRICLHSVYKLKYVWVIEELQEIYFL